MFTPLLAALVACSTPDHAPAEPATAPADAEAATAAGTREDTDLDGLQKAMEADRLIVDVRTDREWQAGHVPGAEHIPLSDLSVDDPVFTKNGRDAPIYFICESGGRSARAADTLAEAGYHTVNIQGGTGAWRSAGKPLETP